ncbi:MAG: YegS/Rv2252/BmrU family lipid kinase, partial [Lachnospiraceae bacterium]|nr:YegS/Rv2252/BmrU family lipid kinase [Lachnospiraceae bacterium]
GRGFDLIVCSGGDGTLDEVVTGMMRGRFRTPLGYIPAGSTNDFANSLGIPSKMRRAAKAIATGEVFPCDVGRLNEDFFIYVAAFGAFTDVSYKTSQESKNALGHAAYLLEGVKSLSTLKSWKMEYHSRERSGEGEFLYGMITNSNSVGGFKGITGRNVDLSDGVFEVTLILMPDNIMEWPAIIAAMLAGEPNNRLITFKTARVEFISEDEVPWTVDGEFGGSHNKVEIENLHKALPIVLGDPDADTSETQELILQKY